MIARIESLEIQERLAHAGRDYVYECTELEWLGSVVTGR